MKITKDKLKEMISYIDEARMVAEDERVQKAYEKVVVSAKVGLEHMADNKEKEAWLNYVLADQSYRVTFYLWRHKLLKDAQLNKVFNFPLPEDAIEYARSFGEEDNEIKRKILEETAEVDKRRKGIEIFQSILAGDDPETAKKKMEEYEDRMDSMMSQMPDQPPVMR